MKELHVLTYVDGSINPVDIATLRSGVEECGGVFVEIPFNVQKAQGFNPKIEAWRFGQNKN